MIIYVHPKCSTCQKALRFLESKGKTATLKDITRQAPSIQELERMLQFLEGKWTKLFNTTGQLYREMGLSQKLEKMPLKEVLSLLASHGMLVKRPFLLGEHFGLVGFKDKEWNLIKFE